VGVSVGLAVENFTPQTADLTAAGRAGYARRAEELGFESLWAWDHPFLGARRAFPFFEALTTLTWLAAHTSQVMLGTGVLVLPLRDPTVLAKVTGTLQAVSGGRLSLGVAAGWYEREFEAVGIPFGERGRIFERNLEILGRLWDEDEQLAEHIDAGVRRVVLVPYNYAMDQVETLASDVLPLTGHLAGGTGP
jgi:alkanesulfonate monooxygenase